MTNEMQSLLQNSQVIFFLCQVTPVQTDLRPLNLVSPMNICLKVNHSPKKDKRTHCFISFVYWNDEYILYFWSMPYDRILWREKFQFIWGLLILLFKMRLMLKNPFFSFSRGKETDFSERKLTALKYI